MNLFELLVILEKHLCKVFCFSSPWSTNVQLSASRKVYAFIIYFLIISILYLSKFELIANSKSIGRVLIEILVVFTATEICVIIHGYNIFSKRFNKFKQEYFANERHLEKVLSRNGENCYEPFLLCVINLVTIVLSAITCYYHFVPAIFITIVRRTIALPIKLQWSLCMYRVDSQIHEVKRIMERALESYELNNSQRRITQNNRDTVQVDGLNLETFETVVKVYRMLVEKRHAVSKYYGVQIALNICLIVSSLIIGCFYSWGLAVHTTNREHNYFLITKLCLFLMDITIIASICQFANRTVRKSLKYLFYK